MFLGRAPTSVSLLSRLLGQVCFANVWDFRTVGSARPQC
jgi:hypothetical protein